MNTVSFVNITSIPIILQTIDNYSKYWDYWWYFTNKYCDHKNIIFASEVQEPSFKKQIKTYKTGHGEWGERLLKILEYIDEDYVFYMQEDFWPTKKFPFTQDHMDKFIKNNIDCWRICEYSHLYNLIHVVDDIYQYHQNSLYTLSHQFSLWKTSFLKKHIKPTETPWQNEIEGSIRINLTPHKIYYQNNKWYEETVRGGRLKTNGINLLKREKIHI